MADAPEHSLAKWPDSLIKPDTHDQWRSSHLAILALRQGRQAARGRKNEAAQCTQQEKRKKEKQENDLQRGSWHTLKNVMIEQQMKSSSCFLLDVG